VAVKVSAPKKRTTTIYNGQLDTDGQVLTCAPATSLPDAKPLVVVCKRIEQATNDLNGAAGFNAVPIGRTRTWTFTYNALGQVLTSNAPPGESGISERTTYTYYGDTTATHTSGDLWTIVNAKGHLTEFLEYNKSGQVTRHRDPNGTYTELTYDLFSRLKSRTLAAGTPAAQTTSYTYDDVGQLIRVTYPDASFITYTYDAAHRLTDIIDGLGSSIHFTLDNSGNRIREEVKDANGALTRQVMREYDALNRLQQVTGAVQ
jgi:YD repeat-containing protein